jgi:hypothetical protein
MKRLTLIAFCLALLSPAAFSQSSSVYPLRVYAKHSQTSATNLNSALAQYWFNTNPTGMDLNGAEKALNGNMEGTFTAGVANSFTRQTASGYLGVYTKDSTTYNIHGGTYSQRIVLSGAMFWISQACAAVKGNKYTQEWWVKASVADTFQITLWDGTNQQTSPNLPVVANTWTKLIYNATALASGAGNFNLRQLFPKTDTARIDDISLTPAYDGMDVTVLNFPMGGSSYAGIIGSNGSTAPEGTWGVLRYSTTTNRVMFSASDVAGAFSASTPSSVINLTGWVAVVTTFLHTGGPTYYANGALINAVANTTVGKLVSTTAFFVGRDYSIAYLLDQVGPCQRVIFKSGLPSNIAGIVQQISAQWVSTHTLPLSYNGVVPVFNVDWTKQGYDKSGNGNTLTPSGEAISMPVTY